MTDLWLDEWFRSCNEYKLKTAATVETASGCRSCRPKPKSVEVLFTSPIRCLLAKGGRDEGEVY